jgi:hypothetical protein
MDVKEVLARLHASPYEEISVRTPHCGRARFAITQIGSTVLGPSGQWRENPGTVVVHLEREGVVRPVCAPQKGEVVFLALENDGAFVQAGEELARIRHFLTKDEVLDRILRHALHLFVAPEKGKYYFIPEVDIKVKAKGCRSLRVEEGMDLLILSRMKRETSVRYSGPSGLVYTMYFEAGDTVDAGAPLFGVCSEAELPGIEDVVARVMSEWEEPAWAAS